MLFRDRHDAGRQLAAQLEGRVLVEPIVLGLPRGGVPVAAEVARVLRAPLDVIVVRKLGVPGHAEYAMGAIGEGGVRVLDGDVIRGLGVSDEQLAAVERAERAELERRAQRYRAHDPLPLVGRTAVLVDDGMATGSTALAASQVARALGAAQVVLAVPVASPPAVQELRRHVDEVVCVFAPSDFRAVGQFYDDFSSTSDAEVVQALASTSDGSARAAVGPGDVSGVEHHDVEIFDGAVALGGRFSVPDPVLGVVVFAHGSGSSRHSPRNRAVAEALQRAGMATLLFDLLTEEEASRRSNVFDIDLLTRRVLCGVRWVASQPATSGAPIGCFGASTGAAAALRAAAERPRRVLAVVSRGGRPDLAAAQLGDVQAATLLIVGGEDHDVLELNRRTADMLRCEHRIEVVPGAGHVFAEPGALETVAELGTDWFVRHLAGVTVPGGHA